MNSLSRILNTFALLKMAWESQTAVLEHFEDDEFYYLYIPYFERLDFVLCQFLGSVGFQDSV